MPSFVAGGDYAVGAHPQAIATADFNGDGNQDVVAANRDGNSVSVLLGEGDGGFAPALTSYTGRQPVAVAAGDFNGDGRPDLVTANCAGGDAGLLIGLGDGTFANSRGIAVNMDEPLALATGDVNGDGRLDLVVTGNDVETLWVTYCDPEARKCERVRETFHFGKVSVVLGNGEGEFQVPATYDTGEAGFPWAVDLGDVNGDGNLDVVTVTEHYDRVHVFRGTGDGGLSSPGVFDTLHRPQFLTLGDLNGDGHLDLLTAGGGPLSVHPGVGDGTFLPALEHPVNTSVEHVAIADLNGDGVPDLITANAASDSVGGHLGIGDGTFKAPVPVSAGVDPVAVTVGDFNGDGRPDAVAANAGADNVSVLPNDGQWPAPDAPTLAIADLSMEEGTGGITYFTFTVTLSATYDQPVSVHYTTADGSATAGQDYEAASGTLTFAPGETVKTITVLVYADDLGEDAESFQVHLNQPLNAFVADPITWGVILNDDASTGSGKGKGGNKK